MNRGSIGFLVFLLSLNSCAAQQVEVNFYEGLKKRQDGAHTEARVCFEKALNAANLCTAAAAAAELISLHSAGVELSAATMMLIRQKAASMVSGTVVNTAADSWARALDVAATAEQGEIDREKFLALLLNGDSRAWDESIRYVLHQRRISMADGVADSAVDDTVGGMANGGVDGTVGGMASGGTSDGGISGLPFTEAENAAIDGRIAASRSRYSEAIIFFRLALRDSPELFFRYPDLLTDLGRSFQYTATGREGIDLFLKWERMLSDKKDTKGQAAAVPMALREFIPDGSENLVRFRLLFFAARIARQRGEKNSELFEKALPYALIVSPEQADACIWYMLDSSLAQGPDAAIRCLETYSSRWHDDAYFADVMDKLARELVFRRQWKKIDKVFTLLENRPGGVTAHYAWIMGRAMEEAFFEGETFAPVYMRCAYNAAQTGASVIPLYYRSLSAAALGAPFLVLPEESSPVSSAPPVSTPAKIQSKKNESDTMLFLMGFFENNAAGYASRFIKAVEDDLSPAELYRLAGALGTAGYYQESMRLVALYVRRNGYQVNRHDLELLYPRPFRELVEQYAGETGIEPSLLFALIRTESAFDPDIVSRAGAVGLTQLMPATAEEMAVRIRRRGGPDYIRNGDTGEDSAINLRDPAVNIHIGATYLAYLNERMENELLALLAYNGGMNRIRRWRIAANRLSGPASASLPPDLFLETVEYPETRNYGRSVMGTAAMYKSLYF